MTTEGTSRRYFLSYRRDDSPGHAGRLADHLLSRFGAGSVFLDVESIEAGADFTAEIADAIARSDAVLIVIGPSWLDAREASGARRLNDPDDFVRTEVRAALDADVRLIPVLVGGASMPGESDLPDAIGGLARRNALELLDRRWREDVDRLVDVLEGRHSTQAGNLPMSATPFLGRQRELAGVLDLLRKDDMRLLTLTGPGGIGKTRLAIQAAFRLAYAYLGGVWFVGLAGLTDPALVLSQIARDVGVSERPDRTLLEAIAERFQRDRALLVIDNVEQLLPDAAEPIADLCNAAPSLDVVVSSREPLRVSAEHEFPVDPLAEEEAIVLFADRARAFRPDFAIGSQDERRSIAEICTRLDRLPLAIELAAARTKVLSIAQIRDRLEQRLPLLTGGARDAPARQRTLRATIAWSYDMLSDEEKVLFQNLAVFAGGCDVEAAEAVCDAALNTIQLLIERSLLRQAGEPGEESRYVMLETVREFALERLDERPDAVQHHLRHAEYFLRLTEAADEHRTSELHWLQRLDTDHDNIRAALGWSLTGADPILPLRLVVAASDAWFGRVPLSEMRRWFSLALEIAPDEPSEVRARALGRLGVLASEQGEDGTVLLEESIACARAAGAIGAEASALHHLSAMLPPERADEAVPMGEEAVRLIRASAPGSAGLAGALSNLGEAFRGQGDAGSALRCYEESLQILRAHQDALRLPVILVNLAETLLAMGDYPRAESFATEALERAEATGRTLQAVWALDASGWVALAEGRLEEAMERIATALTSVRELGHPHTATTLLFGAAGVAAARGDVDRAATLEAAAMTFERELGHQPGPTDSDVHRRHLDALRSASDPSAWAAAAEHGSAMTVDEAIAFALA